MLRRCSRWAAAILGVTAWAVAPLAVAYAQDADDYAALRARVLELHSQAKYAEAVPVAERYLALARSRYGEQHVEFAQALMFLGSVLDRQGKYAEAEPHFLAALSTAEQLSRNTQLVIQALHRLSTLYWEQGRRQEAETFGRRALHAVEQAHGLDHAQVADPLNVLGEILRRQGRHAEALPLHERALSIRERVRGATHSDVGISLNNLALALTALGQHERAVALFQRALTIYQEISGDESDNVRTVLTNLADARRAQNKIDEALALYLRALRIAEVLPGPDQRVLMAALDKIARFYDDIARHAEAEPFHSRRLALAERWLSPDHQGVANALGSVGVVYQALGRFAEAEQLLKRAIAVYEKALGPNHAEVGIAITNLALVYTERDGSRADAEPLFKRGIAILEAALGSENPNLIAALNNLAGHYRDLGRLADAEPLYVRCLAVNEKVYGPDHPRVGLALNNLAGLYQDQGRFAEAEGLLRRSLSLREKAYPNNHSTIGQSLTNLAGLLTAQNRFADAEPLHLRAISVYEATLAPDHPDLITALNNLAGHYFGQRDWKRAAQYWRQSTSLTIRRRLRGPDLVGKPLTGRETDTERLNFRFWALIKAERQLAADPSVDFDALARSTFQSAQWAQSSEAAASLAQMAVRGAKGNAELTALVRERQDLVTEWQRQDARRSVAMSQPPDQRDKASEAASAERLTAIDLRIATIDQRLALEFSDYTALSRPEPLSVDEVQAELRPDEALVLFLDTPQLRQTEQETFLWVVTKTTLRWIRSDLGTPSLVRDVAALRCGLDAALWDDNSNSQICRTLLKAQPVRDRFGSVQSDTLPFDRSRAHALYKAFFDQVEDLIKDKHLLVVPSGALTQLPFQTLVTAPTTQATGGRGSADYRATAWLTRRHAITVLPAVSALRSLRRVAKPSLATKPMIGFGNPLLDGNPAERPWEAGWAKLARNKRSCAPSVKVAEGGGGKRRGVAAMKLRGGRADLHHLRSQSPLHDTADELCAVAKDLKLAANDVVLGAEATETTVKRLSAETRLVDYRVLHFATHGTLAGEISGTSEPGLILTPPTEPTEADDGYLSASEVAALKLDADWVILSACNTAAGGAQGAEALSGLARAFFYAGARALLVSHWAVDSAATVKLISHAVGATTRDKALGRAEALRRAMLAMIDRGELRESHPTFWAPFVVVGEGGASVARGQPVAKVIPRLSRKNKEDWPVDVWKRQSN